MDAAENAVLNAVDGKSVAGSLTGQGRRNDVDVAYWDRDSGAWASREQREWSLWLADSVEDSLLALYRPCHFGPKGYRARSQGESVAELAWV